MEGIEEPNSSSKIVSSPLVTSWLSYRLRRSRSDDKERSTATKTKCLRLFRTMLNARKTIYMHTAITEKLECTLRDSYRGIGRLTKQIPVRQKYQ